MSITLKIESWRDIAAEALPMGEKHFAETDTGVDSRRKFALDEQMLQKMCDIGAMRIYTARDSESGALCGYLMWQPTLDVESRGLSVAFMGPFYVEPGHYAAAARLFEGSLGDLRALGVKCVFPHHRMQGRGYRLGRYFERLGAKFTQCTYSLWIGD